MAQREIIKEFPKCPLCHSTEKLSEMAVVELKKSGKVPEDTFTLLRLGDPIPLETPKFAGIPVKCLINSYDVCGKCGVERVARAEIIMLKTEVQTFWPPGNSPSKPN